MRQIRHANPSASPVFRWFAQRYGEPTPAQKASWPLIAEGKHVLVASPTGTGKTLAAFLSVLDQIEPEAATRGIECLYISPLRALGYDMQKNLLGPLAEIYGPTPPIRVELRTGDTSASDRQKQQRKPPHILLTTPESLALLLSQERWIPLLAPVRWVIVDEIHALAENKRGSHLALSLARLGHGLERPGRAPQCIGLSATVAPLAEVGHFLTGTEERCEIVDVSAAKRVDIRVYTPLRKEPYPASGYSGVRLIRELARLVEKQTTTLVFTNTRSGAEATAYMLREKLPKLAGAIECHHASLDRDVRQEVEDRLKRGELRAVVCSTSLELGIDIGAVDLVVMLSTPKGVSKALQRTGRAGHHIHATSKGVLMATNMNDLVEACATALLARRRQLDEVRIPDAPLDVLAQHLVGMGCIGHWTFEEALKLVRRAWPYRHLEAETLREVLDFLAGGGESLRMQYRELFGKIDLDDEGFETRPGRVRRDFLQNIGVIPSVGNVAVRLGSRTLGTVEESFARPLLPGDIFLLAGRAVKVERHGGMDLWVKEAPGAVPTVPRWNANKMPLSAQVAGEIVRFRTEMRARLELADPEGKLTPEIERWIARRLDCGPANAGIIGRMHYAQHRLSEIPAGAGLLVESLYEEGEASAPFTPAGMRHHFFHSLIGRAANDALARVVALRLSRLRGGNAIATPHDYGFVLSTGERQVFTEAELPSLLAPRGFVDDFEEALAGSDLLKYHFRNAAQTGLMVYRNYFDKQKPLRKVQWSAEVIFEVLRKHEPAHVLLREARRDAMHTFIDVEGAVLYLESLVDAPKRIREVDRVPPLSFAMYATRIKEALHVEDPTKTMERLFHQWWQKVEEVTAP